MGDRKEGDLQQPAVAPRLWPRGRDTLQECLKVLAKGRGALQKGSKQVCKAEDGLSVLAPAGVRGPFLQPCRRHSGNDGMDPGTEVPDYSRAVPPGLLGGVLAHGHHYRGPSVARKLWRALCRRNASFSKAGAKWNGVHRSASECIAFFSSILFWRVSPAARDRVEASVGSGPAAQNQELRGTRPRSGAVCRRPLSRRIWPYLGLSRSVSPFPETFFALPHHGHHGGNLTTKEQG
jgi:hypothetical protein